MPLKVIGTGFGRTGTMSLKLALEQLGFGKCYHMYELIQNPSGISYFEKAQKGEQVNWDELFQGYQSAVDFPVILFYKELIAKYPDAKIIHTTRDTESWYKSFNDTILWATAPSFGRILKMMLRMPFSKPTRKLFKVLKYNGKTINDTFGKEGKTNKELVIKKYHDYNTDVMNFIPEERSLIYDVKTGWAPLCKFLNVPIPETDFPKSNSTQEFISNVKNI